MVYLLPNLVTTAGLFCGFFAIVSAINLHWSNAALAIILAAIFDGLDGRLARLTKTQSAFGEQYDSMCDLVSFGVAPALLMYQWALRPMGRIGWLMSFFFLACAALRLARFNVLKQSTEKRYFQGLASPVAAGTIASAVLFYHEFFPGDSYEAKGIYILVILFSLAAAMVTNIRYRSFKDLNFKSQKAFAYLVVLILLIVLLSTKPKTFMFPFASAYFLSGLIGELYYYIRKKKRKGIKST